MLKIAFSTTRARLNNFSSAKAQPLLRLNSISNSPPHLIVRTLSSLPPVAHHHLPHKQQGQTSTSTPSHLKCHHNLLQLSGFATSATMSTEQKDQLRDSSSLIIAAPMPKSRVQPGKANYKILLLQRSRLGTSASAHVFPGGNVDKADHDPRWATLLNYQSAGPNAPPLYNEICAVREAFEESGVLLCDPPIELSNDAIRIWRDRVHDNAQEFYTLCTSHNVKPAVGRLSYFSSWITPPVETKRFHTQFYLTVLPWSRDSFSELRVCADGKETTRLDWFTPEEALEAYRTNEIQTFLPPQFVTLAHLLPIKRHEDLLEHFAGREIVTIMPEFVLESQDEKGLHLSGILPGDEQHSSHSKEGHTHRVHITRTKKGMNIRSYVQGPIELKARL